LTKIGLETTDSKICQLRQRSFRGVGTGVGRSAVRNGYGRKRAAPAWEACLAAFVKPERRDREMTLAGA